MSTKKTGKKVTTMTYKDVVAFFDKNGFNYTIRDGKSIVTYRNRVPKIEFELKWLELNPLTRYLPSQVSERLNKIKNIIRKENDKSSVEQAMRAIASDTARMAAVIKELNDYGVMQDTNNEEVLFYAENGKIIFFTDIDHIVMEMAKDPGKSVTDILDEMRNSSSTERKVTWTNH